jgi:hypothetical protein
MKCSKIGYMTGHIKPKAPWRSLFLNFTSAIVIAVIALAHKSTIQKVVVINDPFDIVKPNS